MSENAETLLSAKDGAALLGAPEEIRKSPQTVAPVPAPEALTDEARAAAHFANDAKTHTLTIHREDGVFRHLEFTGLAGMSRIILVTWPYNLVVAGSHGSFHFERFGPDTEDMLNWIRGQRPNPASWASKLVNGRRSVEEYDRARLEREVNERVAEAIRDGWAPEGLEEAVRDEILDSPWLEDEPNALRVVSDFEHGMKYRSACSCGKSEDHDSYSAAACWNILTHKGKGDDHKVSVRQLEGFDFDDFTEWNIHKLNYHFLYQCHALVWAVTQYDAARAAAPDFFQPGHVYAREHHGCRIEFHVRHVETPPSGTRPVAFGWRTEPCISGWAPEDSDDMDGWTDVTETGQAPASEHYDKVPDPADGCHWCACGNRWPCKHAKAVTTDA